MVAFNTSLQGLFYCLAWYLRVAPGAFIPELFPERGAILYTQHAGAERSRQGAPAAAGGHACRHAVLWRGALCDEAHRFSADALGLRLRTMHRA